MATMKELALNGGKVIDMAALTETLTELKTYINTAAAEPARQVKEQLDALIGAQEGDADKIINTFNEIKAFLSDYSEDDTLKSLIDAVDSAITTERSRATQAETALGERITTIENVNIMTAAEAKTMFDGIFYPTQQQGGGSSSGGTDPSTDGNGSTEGGE